jgi:hypothetical protein
MACIHKNAIAAIPIIILLLHDPICYRGHHLSLVMNVAKVTEEEAHVQVPAVCQMVKQVYVVQSTWPVFTKRPLLQYP